MQLDTQIFPFLVLITHVTLVVGLIWGIVFPEKIKRALGEIAPQAPKLALIVALTATLGSLYYSEILNFPPCNLCWWQRIMTYPQTLILGLTYWRKQKFSLESLILSAGGLVLAGYHYVLQRVEIPSSWCEGVGYTVSCSDTFEMTFGYITLPLMAATAFGIIIFLMLVNLKSEITSKI